MPLLTRGFSPYPTSDVIPVRGDVRAGVVPLRPLSLADVYNGATAYLRANPRATLGVTAAVVIVVQAVRLAAVLGLLAVTGRVGRIGDGEMPAGAVDRVSRQDVTTWSAVLAAGVSAMAVGAVVLSAVLITALGRAVFGEFATAGQLWAPARRRLPALAALLVLAGLVIVLPIGAGVLLAATAGVRTAVALTALLVLPVGAALGYCSTVLALAVPVVVLERRSAPAAIGRAAKVLRGGFWRTTGILALTAVVAALISNAVALPFGVAGAVLARGWPPTWVPAPVVFEQAGATVGQIIVLPFMIGTLALLYVDRRFRSEGLDLALRQTPPGPLGAVTADDLWLVEPRWGFQGARGA